MDTSVGIDVASADVASPDASTVDSGDSGLTGCAARVPNGAVGLFVAPTGTDGGACTRMSPCRTVQYAIVAAVQLSKSIVYLAANNAPYFESITMKGGVSIEGGWDASWMPICDATKSTAVTIQGVTNITVNASFVGQATLRYLTITTKSSAAPGESLYGIFATGAPTDLTLDQLNVKSAGGGAGVSGAIGSDGANGVGSCAPSNGAPGSLGSNGAAAAPGNFSASGYTPAKASDGNSGTAGANGMSGTMGTCGACSTCTNGNPCVFGQNNSCAGNGLSGCGGKAANGGGVGANGGSSVGVFVSDAQVTVLAGSYTIDNGGDGGNGAVGGVGGAGSLGTLGSDIKCVTQFACINQTCSVNSVTVLKGGAAGTSGGAGGNGGSGGGGSGGFSFAFVASKSSKLVLNQNPTLVHGKGGAGGNPNGATGSAGDNFAF